MNKIKQLLALLSFVPTLCLAQTPTDTENYVQTTTMLDASGTNSVKAVQYYNGLGYPTVAVSTVGTNGQTAATLTTYDALGREDRKYVPVPGSGLNYIKESTFKSSGYYYQDKDNSIFTQNHYDALDRVTAVDIAGEKWRKAGKQNRTEYLANTSTDKVLRYEAPEDGSYKLKMPSNTSDKYYPAGSFSKVISYDADNKSVTVFTDMFGNKILERTAAGDTYYVYNVLGQLRFVLPPALKNNLDSLAIFAYEYRYDKRGRIDTKILPQGGTTLYCYDKADRVAYMKDPALGSKYRFYLYDKLGRLCVQGTCTGGTQGESILSTTSYASGTSGICNTGYTTPYTINAPKLEIVNYYDNYDFMGKNMTTAMPTTSTIEPNSNQKQYAIGFQTGSVVYTNSGEALGSINLYDQKGQVVRSVRKGLGGFVEDVNTQYTFTGAIDNTEAKIKINGYDFIAKTNYKYKYGVKDSMTLAISHGSSAVSRTTEYNYDFAGRLSTKKRQLVRTNKSLCSYTYDVHGWITSISSGDFAEYIYYADGLKDSCYNGNISTIKWRNGSGTSYQAYNMEYDGLNRLKLATYGNDNRLDGNFTSYKDYFNEYAEYDNNGNITKLQRRGLVDNMHGGFGLVDDLNMSYSGNQLTSVRDNATHPAYNGATDFYTDSKTKSYALTYNESGSLVSDASRKIAKIEYDNLNNPVRIQFTNGNVTQYEYSVTGEKLRVIYRTSVYPEVAMIVNIGDTKELSPVETKSIETIDYLLGGALTLRNGRIDKYQFEEGYCQAEKSSSDKNKDIFTFCYYDQDHLGNIRQVREANGSKGYVIQTMNYYPFGAEFCDGSANTSVQKHKYNGKEFDNMHGLNSYDYGARQYNPVTARWDRIDPLCEKYYSVSPYNYCMNNPVMFIDPDGRELYLSGTYDERMYLLQQLQKLTNDRLDMNRKTGKVTIGKMGTKNLKNGKATLTTGTKLIAGIIGDDNKMTIKMDEYAHEHDIYRGDASNGKGTDVEVYMNPNADPCLTENIQNHKIQKEKFKSYIILGHELVHGYRSMKGIARAEKERGSYKYKDVNGKLYKVSNSSLEELETTGLVVSTTCEFTENKLRREHGLNKRIKY